MSQQERRWTWKQATRDGIKYWYWVPEMGLTGNLRYVGRNGDCPSCNTLATIMLDPELVETFDHLPKSDPVPVVIDKGVNPGAKTQGWVRSDTLGYPMRIVFETESESGRYFYVPRQDARQEDIYYFDPSYINPQTKSNLSFRELMHEIQRGKAFSLISLPEEASAPCPMSQCLAPARLALLEEFVEEVARTLAEDEGSARMGLALSRALRKVGYTKHKEQ